ncbi:galactose oxidase-like domain-containing protein [Actinocorallia longicatena]|uniref:Glyoxal oxidase-like protein n=1 Tax=Actinocorallia longicatena TaxID=111803 RepID=A0ABP6QRV0_9ACTN
MAPASAVPSTKVQNPGFESGACWTALKTSGAKGTVGVVKGGRSGKRAASVTSANGKGAIAAVQKAGCAIKVTAGKQYDLTLYYKTASAKSAVMLFRRTAGGKWVKWQYFPFHPASGGFRRATVRTAAVPAGTREIRYAMGLAGAGTLVTDDYKISAAKGAAPCTYGSACTKGRWEVKDFGGKNERSIHSVLMYNGKVLLIAGSGNSRYRFAGGTFSSTVYDPKTGRMTKVKTPYDMFCAGHVQLADGRILIMGGTDGYAKFEGPNAAQSTGWTGSRKSYIFNPRTNKYEKSAGLMKDGHWYPSATILPNGDVYSVGGYNDAPTAAAPYNVVSKVAELYSAKSRKWVNVAQPNINWATYPALIQTKYKDMLFYSGSSVFGSAAYNNGQLRGPGFFNPRTGAFKAVPGLTAAGERDQSASLLLPPAQNQRVMILGGKDFASGKRATNDTNIVDLSKGFSSRYRSGPDLLRGLVDPSNGVNNPVGGAVQGTRQPAGVGKTYLSAVILPNGKVFETGGSQIKQNEHVHEAATFDPSVSRSREKWTAMAADPVNRTYHSMALLLPDGRVLAAGSNKDDEYVAGYTAFDMRLSIYTPPYLFHGGQPVLSLANPKKGWAYGSSHEIRVSQSIKSASLIRPAAVTHSSDPNQRSVKLPITSLGGGRYKVKLDKRREITPPGWYMLFVNNSSGVPSVAKWIHVS